MLEIILLPLAHGVSVRRENESADDIYVPILLCAGLKPVQFKLI